MSSMFAHENGLKLHSVEDALDVLSSGLPGCIFLPDDLHPDFFELRNGMLGDIFQKFVNYNFRVAFIIPETHEYGDRVTELIRDHNQHPCIRFFASTDESMKWLSQR